jgi:uncharacterized membrane protein YeiB
MKEDKMKINDIINLLGVLGVIFSLIFVGLELQQSQRIAIAGQVQARAEMLANRSLALMEGEAESMSEIYSRDQSVESANPKSEVLRSAQIGWNIAVMTNTFYQYIVGLLTEEQFAVARKRMISFKANCQIMGDIEAALFFAETSFVEFFDKLPNECAE